MPSDLLIVDGLQYCNFSEGIFRQMRVGGVSAVHVTVCYHEMFRETVANLERWNRWFEQFPELIFKGASGEDVRRAQSEGRTAIFFGAQNASPMEDDIGLIEILHALGLRFMQLTYNNQSLLATGCYEAEDTGLTRMGRQVVREMNRVGLVVDMSHSGERSTLEAIEHSTRPIAITHANPKSWHPALRNKSDDVLKALAASGGMLGFSLYPHHLKGGRGVHAGEFLRDGGPHRRSHGDRPYRHRLRPVPGPARQRGGMDAGRAVDEGDRLRRGIQGQRRLSAAPAWFKDNLGHRNIAAGLAAQGFQPDEVAKIMGGNWLAFFDASFGPGA